jgi:hypothetical protein
MEGRNGKEARGEQAKEGEEQELCGGRLMACLQMASPFPRGFGIHEIFHSPRFHEFLCLAGMGKLPYLPLKRARTVLKPHFFPFPRPSVSG